MHTIQNKHFMKWNEEHNTIINMYGVRPFHTCIHEYAALETTNHLIRFHRFVMTKIKDEYMYIEKNMNDNKIYDSKANWKLK